MNTPSGWDQARVDFLLAERDGLKELLAEHQELGRLLANRLDDTTRELGETQARLRAAQGEVQRLNTLLHGYDRQMRP